MKKFVGLLFMMLMILVLTACNTLQIGEQPDLNGAHFIHNGAGEYIWLGMSLEDVERIDFGEGHSFEVREIEDYDHVFYGELVLTNWGGVLAFDENEQIHYISAFSSFPIDLWFAHGSITIDSKLSEVEEVFDMNYVYIDPLLPWWSFHFTYDHVPVYRDSEDVYYSITFIPDRVDEERVFGFSIRVED